MRKKSAKPPIVVTVVHSLEPIDFEAWLTDAIRAILEAQREKAQRAAHAFRQANDAAPASNQVSVTGTVTARADDD